VCVLGLALGLTNIYLLNLTYGNNTVEMVLKTHLERRVLGLVLAGGDEPRGRSERMCTRKTHHYHRILHLFIRTRSQFDVTSIGTNSHPLCTSSRVRGFRLRMISLSITPCLN
jgi:hypothetical protein